MRWCVSVGAVLVAGMIVGGDVAGIAAPSPKSRSADTKHNDYPSMSSSLSPSTSPGLMDMTNLPFSARAILQPSSRKTSFRR